MVELFEKISMALVVFSTIIVLPLPFYVLYKTRSISGLLSFVVYALPIGHLAFLFLWVMGCGHGSCSEEQRLNAALISIFVSLLFTGFLYIAYNDASKNT